MTTSPTGWEGILADGESILWQDRPATGVFWRDLLHPLTFFGLFFFGFSVFWVAMASVMSSGPGGFGLIFPMFGIPFVLVGFYLLVGRIFWDAYVRAHTWYTLTDRAAYTATDVLGRRSLKRVGFDEMTRLDLEDSRPGSVWFSETIATHSYRHRRSRSAGYRSGPLRTQTTVTPVGFARIPEPRPVYRMIADRRATLTGDKG